MNKLRFVGAFFLAMVLMVPQGALAVEARAPALTAAFVPVGGNWTGKTNLGYGLSFTVSPSGANWSNFATKIAFAVSGVCNVSLAANVSGPGSTSTFAGTSGAMHFQGAFTSATTATGTYSWTNVSGIAGCSKSGTWTANAPAVPPGAFVKTSPVNGATNQSPASLLRWTPATNAKSYQYCLDLINNNTCDTTWVTAGAATSVDPPGTFALGRTYYWQVRAVNGTSFTVASGGWWSFTTVPISVMTLRSLAPQDGWVLESSETSGVGGSTKNANGTAFLLGDDKLNRQYRAILSFATGNLPSNAVIVSARLSILKNGGSLANPFGSLGHIVVDAKRGPFGTFQLQSLDFQAPASLPGALAIANTPVGGWYSGSMASANFTYINRLGPTQFRLRFGMDDNNNFHPEYLSFFSGNALTFTNRPKLVIQYYVP